MAKYSIVSSWDPLDRERWSVLDAASDEQLDNLLSQHQDAVKRLAEVPGLGVDSATQIIAEVGLSAATFPPEKQRSSWVSCASRGR